MKAVAYCRISPDEEASADAYTAEQQQKDIEEYCQDKGIELADVRTDHAGIGFSESRPELDRLKEGDVPEGTEAIICASTDRIAGNVKQFLFLKQQLTSHGLAILCIEENSGETGAGKFAPQLGRE